MAIYLTEVLFGAGVSLNYYSATVLLIVCSVDVFLTDCTTRNVMMSSLSVDLSYPFISKDCKMSL